MSTYGYIFLFFPLWYKYSLSLSSSYNNNNNNNNNHNNNNNNYNNNSIIILYTSVGSYSFLYTFILNVITNTYFFRENISPAA